MQKPRRFGPVALAMRTIGLILIEKRLLSCYDTLVMPQMVAIEKSRLLEIADLLQQVSVLTRAIVQEQKFPIPEDQKWFWTPEWQAGEREVDEQLARGEYVEFDSAQEAIAYLHG